MKAIQKIKSLPLSPQHKKAMAMIAPDLDRVASFDSNRVARIRASLNALKHKSPRSQHHIICAALCVIKTLTDQLPQSNALSDYAHRVTDHALVCAMRRYLNIDINAWKDEIDKLATECGWPKVVKNGRVITYYPPEAAQ